MKCTNCNQTIEMFQMKGWCMRCLAALIDRETEARKSGWQVCANPACPICRISVGAPVKRSDSKANERLDRLRRRLAHLEERISLGEKSHRNMGFDKAEASALQWAIEKLQPFVGCCISSPHEHPCNPE